MRSKTSKRAPARHFLSPASACSEREIAALARDLASEFSAGDRVLLEGPMGAGKSTFARALLRGLGVEQPPEGSPTFAIAHEYLAPVGEVVHIDLYRLKSEEEIEEAGIHAYVWERDAVTLIEWTSMWPGFEEAVLRPVPGRRTWRVTLSFVEDAERRQVGIELLSE